jgi:murein DD-endopeptidase MepM/ murein hydrolase activator NlpD
LPKRIYNRLNSALERILPEQRLFLKSDTSTRFVRLRPLPQAVILTSIAALFGWSVIASSMLFIEGISSGSAADQTALSRSAFEQRLDQLSEERNNRSAEALTAQNRFQLALSEVSTMQSSLLSSEERRRELETGIEVIQKTLRRTMKERDEARLALAETENKLGGGDGKPSPTARAAEMSVTVDMLTAALSNTANQRDSANRDAEDARIAALDIANEKRTLEARNDEIFSTLEGAVNVSMSPLDKMFKAAGLNPADIIQTVRRGYSGSGGPLMPIAFSTSGAAISPDEVRANKILSSLDQMNVYRIAVNQLPFDTPLKSGAFRFSSQFGYRWGRLHAGVDLATPIGTAVNAPADGTVIAAEVENGYGNVIKIQHAFGISTVYAHLSKIRVTKGQKVSRGDRIGDTGNTGRSTGPHLHYEIRVSGKPTNPMTFIKAANDVF